MTNIVVIGSLNMDLIALTPRLPVSGETILGTSFLNEPGGKGANQAYAAAKLGGEVAMLGRIGRDDYGERMCANLASVECDVSGIQQVATSSGIAMILVAKSGENTIVVVPGANYRYLPSDLYADAPRLLGSKFVLLQLEIPLETVMAATQVARQRGAQVILDPAPVPINAPVELFQGLDVLTPNETEAVQLLGNKPAPLSIEEAGVVTRRLQSFGTKTVIMKLGARGCILAHEGTLTTIPAPVVTAADTTAAGDVFNAAFAVASAEGASRLEACRFAVHAAALSVTRIGAQASMPSLAEVQQFQDSGLNFS
jgi:ribokinase